MTPRIYSALPLARDADIVLDAVAARHLREALRLVAGDALVLFDGRGGEYEAVLTRVSRHEVAVRVGAHHAVGRESPLALTLAQGISRGERMDYTLQKAVELGVTRFVPLATERSTVKLDEARAAKRTEHWAGIVRHACEQSGRTRLPGLAPPTRVEAYAAGETAVAKLLLDPQADTPLAALPPAPSIALAIGPEGGFGANERAALSAAGFRAVRLGPRVLRTETAALVALSILQAKFGDLA
ncbi:MAG: 16S rRNA (uracil(1498)-N(3))-methyltransferase [Gammaproteobacteria bacterium]